MEETEPRDAGICDEELKATRAQVECGENVLAGLAVADVRAAGFDPGTEATAALCGVLQFFRFFSGNQKEVIACFREGKGGRMASGRCASASDCVFRNGSVMG